MDTILRTIPAHFDGTHVRFDIEGIEKELQPNTPLLVTVLVAEPRESDTANVVELADLLASKSDPSEIPAGKYDFSAFAGKLKWQGDAIVEQRKLRDEWD